MDRGGDRDGLRRGPRWTPEGSTDVATGGAKRNPWTPVALTNPATVPLLLSSGRCSNTLLKSSGIWQQEELF